MALVAALTLLSLQGAYTASLPEATPARQRDLFTTLPDKSHQTHGVYGEPLTLILAKDVKRVFTRKGFSNKPAASGTVRLRNGHSDLETHLNDSHELHEPALSLLDNVSLQEPDDTVLRNAVAQLMQEVEDREAKKHNQYSNAKKIHKTSSVHEDSIDIANVTDRTTSPSLNAKVIESSYDGRASVNAQNGNSQGRVDSLDNTTNVRNGVEERSVSSHGHNKVDESSNAILALDDLLKSDNFPRVSSIEDIDYDFRDKISQVYDDLNNTPKKEIKALDNLSEMEHQNTSNKNSMQQNELNKTQHNERNDEIDSKHKLNSNDNFRRNYDNEHEALSLKTGRNEDHKKQHQGSHDNHLLRSIAAPKQNDENGSYDRRGSNHDKLDNLLTKESRKDRYHNNLQQNNNDVDYLRKSRIDHELDDNWSSVIRLTNTWNEYDYNDDNKNRKEKNSDPDDEFDYTLKVNKKNYSDNQMIKQDRKHSKDKTNYARVYWLDVNPKKPRKLLKEDKTRVKIDFNDGQYRNMPTFLRARFNDDLKEHLIYVDGRNEEKTNEDTDINESIYGKRVDGNSQFEVHNHGANLTKNHRNGENEITSHENDDHRRCKQSKKTYALSFHFKK